MAVTIASNLPQLAFSSALPDVRFSVGTAEAVQVSVMADRETLFSERLYASAGVAILYDLAELVERHLKALRMPMIDITVTATDDAGSSDSASLSVLYCASDMPAGSVEAFTEESFLTTAEYLYMPPGEAVVVPYYAKAMVRHGLDAVVTYRDAQGQLKTVEGNIVAQHAHSYSAVFYYNVYYEALVDLCRAGEVEVVCAVLTDGLKRITIGIDPELAEARCFRFLNCFNCYETVFLLSKTTSKVDLSRSVAVMGATRDLYDVKDGYSFETECGGLSLEEAVYLRQLITSPRVMTETDIICCNHSPAQRAGAIREILITGAEVNIDSEDEELKTIKFSWEFDSTRLPAMYRFDRGVFTDQFTIQFT